MKFKEGYPRYDTETPEQLKKIIDNFARSGLHEEDTYDEKTNIIIPQKVNHLPESLSAVSEKDLQNPHIKFFVERNPGYTKVYNYVLEVSGTAPGRNHSSLPPGN